MANYMATSRTNYFRVTDEDRYQELLENLVSEDNIEDFTERKGNVIYHGFGTYGTIDYCKDEDEDEYDFDYFLAELQKILPQNEAFIYMESGSEKLRYVVGYAIVVTRDSIEPMSIDRWATKQARKLLSDPEWRTQTEY